YRSEIIGVRVGAAADEAQQAHAHAEHADRLNVEREDAERLAMLERDQYAQRLSCAIHLPPLVLPYPRVEDARGLGLIVNAVPVRREACKVLDAGDELHRDFAARMRPHRQEMKSGIRVAHPAPLHLACRIAKKPERHDAPGSMGAVLTESC